MNNDNVLEDISKEADVYKEKYDKTVSNARKHVIKVFNDFFSENGFNNAFVSFIDDNTDVFNVSQDSIGSECFKISLNHKKRNMIVDYGDYPFKNNNENQDNSRFFISFSENLQDITNAIFDFEWDELEDLDRKYNEKMNEAYDFTYKNLTEELKNYVNNPSNWGSV